jgi:hypothetical protein
MKKLLLLALVVCGSMFARNRDCSLCHNECATTYEAAVPVCQELRLVTVPAEKQIYYSCPTPSCAHTDALNVFNA